jgi:RNA polymerase sigma factor (sigma-70 family)
MVEKPDIGASGLQQETAAIISHELKFWFVREVLPLETTLMQFLRHSWRHAEDIDVICQDVYIRVFEAAQKQIPSPTKPFVFAVARNLLIDRYRHNRIVPIDGVPDLAAVDVGSDDPGPDRGTIARSELRLLRDAFGRLPPRCREVLVLKRIENRSRREIAVRLGISENTVKQHLVEATRRLADMLYGEDVSSKS